MIQDHLIKFSTFLQYHEMRRKKDFELHRIETEKINEKNEEIKAGNDMSEGLKGKAAKIE